MQLVCFYFSENRDINILDEDRKKLLSNNRKELCKQIVIKTGELLDLLVKKAAITARDKEFIMVTDYALYQCEIREGGGVTEGVET